MFICKIKFINRPTLEDKIYQGFFGSATPFAFPPPFFRLFIFVHRLVNQDDRHLLAHCAFMHMQWPLTSQSHGSVSQKEQLVFHYRSNSTP
jgi:hypothetical protein